MSPVVVCRLSNGTGGTAQPDGAPPRWVRGWAGNRRTWPGFAAASPRSLV